MAKQTGMGSAFYVGGSDLSGDIQALGKISGTVAPIDVTDITQSGYSRLGGLRDGAIDYTAYFDPTSAHPVLSALPVADQVSSYLAPPLAVGSPVCSCVAKQIGYDPARDNAGALTVAMSVLANAFGLEWGLTLTAGMRTDTAATNGASVNNGAATAFGAQAYLHVSAFTGTDVTVTIQDSADNVTFANVAGLSFTAVTSAPQAQRISVSNTSTVRQYVRAVTTTVGGFTSVTFAVQFTRNLTAGQVF